MLQEVNQTPICLILNFLPFAVGCDRCRLILQAYYRGAKAGLALKLWAEASEFCSGGLKYDPGNEELRKLQAQGQQRLAEEAERKKRSLETKSRFEVLSSYCLKSGNSLK